MAEPSPSPASGTGPGVEPGEEPFTGAPRWAKTLGLVTLAVVVLLVVVMLAGGGSHGPGRHLPSSGGDAPPASTPTEHVRPEGGHGP
jgi:predicted small lipoprotein YifL